MINKIVSRLRLHSRIFQKFWRLAYRFSLAGMNVGCAAEVSSSGERWAFRYFLSKRQQRQQPNVVFDVGANKGQWASMALAEASTVDLYCFEPSMTTYTQLKSALGHVRSVKLFNTGFSDQMQTAMLYSDKPGSGLASIFARRLDHFEIAMSPQEEVQLTTIDQFCGEQHINRIDFLKLDVEGAEISVLAGAETMLSKDAIDFIQFEFGGCNIDSRTFLQDFWYKLTPRYALYRIVADGLVHLPVYSETFESFLTTNFLAIHTQVL